ncbi:MAG: metallophosphoesterase [Lachnospiraceae bacterium]|nr:metallophosphoesterase [Lachnospiraceae bacterium]MDD5852994.1 metallophosphoesterase [Lachnospiraceae bacterium]
MGTYVISDIHGCYDEFMEMLEKIQFHDDDNLICAGDYIDKGPKNAEMLYWILNAPFNAILIRGNHDEDFVQNIDAMRIIGTKMGIDPDDTGDTMILYQSIRKLSMKNVEIVIDRCGTIYELISSGYALSQLCRWAERIKKMPFFYKTRANGRECVVVHAGYVDNLDIPELRTKYASKKEFYMNSRVEEYRYGGIRHGMVVAGHTPTIKEGEFAYNDGRIFRMYDKEKDCVFYDIDCGCCMRNENKNARLACLRLEDEKEYYI